MVNKKRIVIFTDAWYPQVNGVVTTYINTIQHIDHERHEVEIIEPSMFTTIKLPFYKEIGLSIVTRNRIKEIIKRNLDEAPVCRFHIATEGPIGYKAKRVLDAMHIKYTTAYHTKFPEFIEHITKIPVKYTSWYFDWFHRSAKTVIVSSNSTAREHPNWNTRVMGKGYDDHFRPDPLKPHQKNKVKTLLYVGRVSKEKNIEDFCRIYLPNINKVVVGDGPDRKRLKKKYPDVHFVGYKFGELLAEQYRQADVFVFPSRTDTYGIVILEAMACGTPVAAYPVTGPIDQIKNGVNGYTGSNLLSSVINCMSLSREKVYSTVKDITWQNAAKEFIQYLEE